MIFSKSGKLINYSIFIIPLIKFSLVCFFLIIDVVSCNNSVYIISYKFLSYISTITKLFTNTLIDRTSLGGSE